jgi:hypothetical protein
MSGNTKFISLEAFPLHFEPTMTQIDAVRRQVFEHNHAPILLLTSVMFVIYFQPLANNLSALS